MKMMFLISGKYYKKNSQTPISEIIDGNGVATLYDEEGIFLHKIPYQNGKSQISYE